MSDTSVWVGAWLTPLDAAAMIGDSDDPARDEELAGRLHLTLGYFSFTTRDAPTGVPVEGLRDALAPLASYVPTVGVVDGAARLYVDPDTDARDVDVLTVRSNGLDAAHRHLEVLYGNWLDRTHPWRPHVTVPAWAIHRRRQTLRFDRILLCWGEMSYVLGSAADEADPLGSARTASP